jgi:hypothetical protein
MVGWLAAEFGGRSPFVIGGVIAALSAAVCGVVLARRGGLRLPGRPALRDRGLRRRRASAAQDLEKAA